MIDTLTGLRGLATLMVLAAGLAAAGILPSEFGSGLDQIGLMIVVTLSGYLLAVRHLNERWDRYAVGAFLLSRAKRLLPLYYVVLALSAAVTGWWSAWPYRIDSWGSAILAILLLDAPGPLWIVPALAQLSLLFVALWWLWFRLDSNGGRRGVHVAAVLVVGGVVCAVALLGPTGWAWPSFLIGLAIGLTWTDRIEPFLADRERWVAIGGAVAFVLACINLPAVRLAHGWSWGLQQPSVTWLDPFTALIVLVLVGAAAARPISLAVLAASPLRILGRCFYPIYLVLPILVVSYVALSM
jgi:peptidoglycan/LPS O-acetylase OafA/YrhL